ncbi:MAG: hypothetical protein U1F98_15150 [Verrucomicrobiota bacterium]
MSLKAFHLLFVGSLTSLSFGCAAWKFTEFAREGGASNFWFGLGAVAAGIAVLIYGRYFLKKLKHIRYL